MVIGVGSLEKWGEAYKPGDITKSMSQSIMARRKREEEEKKEIDYLHLFKTYGLAGMAQLGGQEIAKAVVSPVMKGIQSVAKDVFVDPYTRKTTAFLSAQVPNTNIELPKDLDVKKLGLSPLTTGQETALESLDPEAFDTAFKSQKEAMQRQEVTIASGTMNKRMINQANNMADKYNTNLAHMTAETNKGLSKRQVLEEGLITKMLPEIRANLRNQVAARGEELNIDKFSDTQLRTIAHQLVNEPVFYKDSEGTLFDAESFERLSLAHDVKRKGTGLPLRLNTSLLDLREASYNEFNKTIELIPGGVANIKAFPQTVAAAATSSNMFDAALDWGKNLGKTDLRKQGRIVQLNAFEDIDLTTKEGKELIKLNPEMEVLKRMSGQFRTAHERHEWLKSVNSTAMIEKAMKRHDMLKLAKTIATDTTIEEEIEFRRNEDGSGDYVEKTKLMKDFGGQKIVVSEETEMLHNSDDRDGRLLGSNLQKSAHTNLNNILKATLSEDGRQYVRNHVAKLYENPEWKPFLTDGTGAMLNEFSSDLNIEQYSYYANLISKTFALEEGRYGLKQSEATNEAFKMFIGKFDTQWTEYRIAQAAYGNIKKSITTQRGVVYDNSWMFVKGDKKNNFDVRRFISQKGTIIDGSIPQKQIDQAKAVGIPERALRKHVTDLHSRLKNQPAAEATLNEKFAVLHSLHKDFNILTRQKELLSSEERERALKIGVDEKYIYSPVEIIKEADKPPVVTSTRSPYDRVNVSDETRTEKNQGINLNMDSFLVPNQNISILETLKARERRIRGRQ